jgi:hypothetical protein
MEANAEVEATAGVRQAGPSRSGGPQRVMVYIDQAALLMSAAFAAADIRHFAPARRRQTIQPHYDAVRWCADVTNDVLTRLTQIRHSLAHGWSPSPEADTLAAEAVGLLAELTPVLSQLVALYRSNRTEGLAELVRHLEIVDRQYALAATLVCRPEAGHGGRPSSEPAPTGFTAAREALLAAAGGGLSLTEAAQALGVTRQNLHKRIHTGSALGMLLDNRIVLPKLQMVVGDGRASIVAGIERVVHPFLEAKAGAWSALQFPLDPDPDLRRSPIDALHAGDVVGAENAARAYLGLDEGGRRWRRRAEPAPQRSRTACSRKCFPRAVCWCVSITWRMAWCSSVRSPVFRHSIASTHPAANTARCTARHGSPVPLSGRCSASPPVGSSSRPMLTSAAGPN